MKTNWTHLTSNAETHNFPTSICPFPGAATGTGGRIRDTIGKGGLMLSNFAVIMVIIVKLILINILITYL